MWHPLYVSVNFQGGVCTQWIHMHICMLCMVPIDLQQCAIIAFCIIFEWYFVLVLFYFVLLCLHFVYKFSPLVESVYWFHSSPCILGLFWSVRFDLLCVVNVKLICTSSNQCCQSFLSGSIYLLSNGQKMTKFRLDRAMRVQSYEENLQLLQQPIGEICDALVKNILWENFSYGMEHNTYI